MEAARGYFIMIDSPDGVGKGTLINWIADYFVKRGKEVYNLKTWWNKYFGGHPSIDELRKRKFEVLISAEPTYAAQGIVIRNELINENAEKAGRIYSSKQIAQAFALDRAILYQNVIIPALEAGIIVVQERGFPSSFAYQPLDAKRKDETLTLEEIQALEGNQLAMKHPPNLLIIPTLETEEAIKRLEGRLGKQDDSIFDNKPFQEQLREAYSSPWFKELMLKLGTVVEYVSANGSIEETGQRLITVLEGHLKKAGIIQ